MIGNPNVEIYKIIGDVALQMHLFTPADGCQHCTSSVLFFFGGGWSQGSVSHFYPQARYLASRGMFAACAEYRIYNKHGTSPFEAVSDAKSAVRWLRRESPRFGIKPDQIVAGGGSAGGHLAVCSALIPELEEPGEDPHICSSPNALVLFNPVLDTSERGYVYGKATTREMIEISPSHHVRPNLPPTLIMHGDADTVSPYENAVQFTRQMEASGNVCRLITYPGRSHGFFNRKETGSGVDETDFRSTLKKTAEFLEEMKFLPVQ